MRIKVLGTRGEVEPSSPYHAKHSGVLVDGEVLFDLGEREFLDLNPRVVFITHLHPDHAFFVNEPAEVSVPLYGPEAFGKNPAVDIRVLEGAVDFDTYRVTPIPTHHSLRVKSQAYLLQKGEERILYTGDMVWIDKRYHPLLNGLDLVVTEGSFDRRGGRVNRDAKTGKVYGHTGVPNLVRLFREFTGNILITHFGTWFYEDPRGAVRKLKELGRENGVNVIAGYDGLELDLVKEMGSPPVVTWPMPECPYL
ncbi:MAG: MBL fold metallo-hydrolase [Syntrophobacterales bacterium]|nr:MBL fold metallo-hydrolase [Syntrophobacterales bacterium]